MGKGRRGDSVGYVARVPEGRGRPPLSTLTSNKGGELMREGAPADTCGYRPTLAIKPSTDPQKTLELNAPRPPLFDRVPPSPHTPRKTRSFVCVCVCIYVERERGTSGRTLSNKNFESLSYSFHINMSRGLIFEPVRYFMIYCRKLLKLLIREKFILKGSRKSYYLRCCSITVCQLATPISKLEFYNQNFLLSKNLESRISKF